MPGQLLELHVENFRSLRDVTIPLGPLTILVGANGVGKSNVLKVFDLLADIIRTDLEPALETRGGFDEVAFWGGPSRRQLFVFGSRRPGPPTPAPTPPTNTTSKSGATRRPATGTTAATDSPAVRASSSSGPRDAAVASPCQVRGPQSSIRGPVPSLRTAASSASSGSVAVCPLCPALQARRAVPRWR